MATVINWRDARGRPRRGSQRHCARVAVPMRLWDCGFRRTVLFSVAF